MAPEDGFIKKMVLHHKLADAKQVAKAEKVAANKGLSLVDALVALKTISPKHKEKLLANYAKRQSARRAKANTVDLPAADFSTFTKLTQYLEYARTAGASDLHIDAGSKALVRLNGVLAPLPREDVSPTEAEKLLLGALTEAQRALLEEEKTLDFCLHLEGQGRYRSCIVKQRIGYDGAFRIVQNKVPTLADLGLPERVARLTEYHMGIVLVTGPIGCGKSTTMAALVELVNQNRTEHVITLEEPIEFVFEPAKCQVTQREVGSHTESFSAALRAALREDPDVIMIGELRDLETVSLAISAAETGHLVFGSLHTTSAARTVDRLLNVFPPDQQSQVRVMISESIKGIICQQLVPRRDGSGRALALELLFNNAAVGNLIRDSRLHQMQSVIQMSQKEGMLLMDNSLEELVQQKLIHGEDAYFRAEDPSRFEEFAPKLA